MYKVNCRITIKNVINGIVVILITILIIANFLPVKMSVKPNKLNEKDKNDTVILCEYGQTTGPNWVIIGNDKVEFGPGKCEFINVKWSGSAKMPNSSIFIGQNKYVLYGKFIGVEAVDEESYRVFEAKRWDIQYPIHRFSLRSYLTPKRYLNIFDFLNI